nr:IPT/TIG domain-containing protein [Actinomycetota bacterium]
MLRAPRALAKLPASVLRRAAQLSAGLALVAGALGGLAGTGALGLGPTAAAASGPGVAVNFLQTASDGTVNNNDGYGNNTISASEAFLSATWPSTFGLTTAQNLPYGNTPCPGVAGCPAATSTAVWQYGITPLNSGGLVANSSGDDSVTLTAPAGTVFPAAASSYVLTNLCFNFFNAWLCTSQNHVPVQHPPTVDRVAKNKVVIPVPFSVAQNATFGVFVAGVQNPAELQQGSSASNPYQYPAGDFMVSSSVDPIPGQPSQGLAFDSSTGYQPFSSLTASQTTAVVGTANGVSITATSLDQYGNPVNGEQISIVETTGSATPAPSSPQPTSTDQSGQETFTYVDTTAETATFTAYDITQNFAFPAAATVQWVAGSPSATFSQVTAVPLAVPANGTTASLVTVDLADQFGNPDLNQPIILTPVGGTAPPGQRLFTSGTVTTLGGTGCDSLLGGTAAFGCTGATPVTAVIGGKTVDVAQVQFDVTDPTAETVTFGVDDLATLSGGSFSTPPFTVTVTFGATAPTTATSAIAPSSQTAMAGGTPATVTVTLRDANGNPVPGMAVTLGPAAGTASHATITAAEIPTSASGCAVQAAAGTTDCRGQASFSVADTHIEAVVLAATYRGTPPGTGTLVTGDVSGTATVSFEAGPASPTRSTVVAAPTSALANGTAAATVTVTLRDAAGNLAVGRQVNLSPGASHSVVTAVAIPDSSSGCASQAPAGTTDCNGQAAFAVTDGTIETATYTATDVTDVTGGVPVTITQTATVSFTATPAVGTTTVTASPGSVQANGTSASTVTVTLRDAGGNPIPGKQLCLTQATGTAPGGGPCPAAGTGPSTATATTIPTATSGCPTQAPAGTTDCHGQVTFAVTATAAGTVTYGVIDTTDYPGGSPLGPYATVTFTAVPTEAGQSSVTASPAQALAAATGSAGTIIVTVVLRDAGGAPIAGDHVALAPQAGSSAVVVAEPVTGCPTPPAAGTSDCTGEAQFAVTDATAQAVVLTATDTTTHAVIDQTAAVRFVPNEAAVSTVTAASPTATAGGSAVPGGTDLVTVALDPGMPVVGDQVQVTAGSASGAVITPVAIPTSVSGCATAAPPGVSDCTGTAEFEVSDPTAGAVTFVAVDHTTSVKIAETVTITFLPPAPVVTSVSPATGLTTGGTVVTVTGTNLAIAGATSTVAFGPT